VSAISIKRLPQYYPFMETVRSETLQAQGWEKWLSWIRFAGRNQHSALLNQGIKKRSLTSRSFMDTGFYDWNI